MPYTLNGKIDKKALPFPEKIQLANEGHVPDRAGEDADILSKIKAIIRANAEIALPREEIGPHSHLSDLGIHSITFIKMIVALETFDSSSQARISTRPNMLLYRMSLPM
ncbi:phosphopantetheine-binding protein [Paenibacillus thiaminolyticus]|uniref:phosphopantetheine-binding protein n=1 Tax=Paenibacillus thiaminolyticus TaxID=49283 RepID=UPI0025432A4A|nr:phosphopantetheine-binding protein [Paenibacillus thiaminolyticus]WII39445.1 phosphopantetheine-binding protein [Paenibacillus thiaminolyticus]